MKTTSLAIILLLLCLCPPESFAQPGNGQPAFVYTYPLDFTLWDRCNEEYVHITGEVKEVFRYYNDANGCLHMVYSISYKKAVGVGLQSGTKYQVSRMEMARDNEVKICDTEDCVVNQTYTYRLRLISQGGGSNRIISITEHLTLNYCTWEAVVLFSHVRIECT